MADEDLVAEEAALREVFEKRGIGSSPRDLLFKAIVKQALAGAPWREICNHVMQQQNIQPKDVEAVVRRVRKANLEGPEEAEVSVRVAEAIPERQESVTEGSDDERRALYRNQVLEVIVGQALAGVSWHDLYRPVMVKLEIKPQEVQAILDWLDKEPKEHGPRDQVFKVIVKQALLDERWRELCDSAMRDQNIIPEEVEAVMQWIRKTNRDAEAELSLTPPDSAAAFFKRGRALFDSEQYEKAVEDFSRTLTLDKRHRLAYINRGLLHGVLKQNDKAVEDFSKALELLQKDLAFSYLYRGIAYVNLGQQEKSIPDFERAIALDPNDARAYYNRGIAHFNSGRFESAVEDYSHAIELDPAYADAYCNRAIAYVELGEHQKAIDDHTTVIELNPDDGAAYLNRASVYARLNEKGLAEDDLQKSIELRQN